MKTTNQSKNIASSSFWPFIPSKSRSEHVPKVNEQGNPQLTVAEAIVEMLANLGIECAFGVSGGGIAPLWVNLEQSELEVFHFRHEAGAAFSAVESYFATDKPVVVFTTTGPGITNALTGLLTARGEGAKVILLSAYSSSHQRGRHATQETSTYTLPTEGLFTPGSLFHYANILESSAELPEVSRRLALGMTRPGGFVAHLSVPIAIQTSLMKTVLPQTSFTQSVATAQEDTIYQCAELLSAGEFAIWLGFGARGAAEEILELAERTGAPVMCSPRAKGIFPETHPQFIGVTGFAGHDSVVAYMQQFRPLHTLVLGSRLSEPTSFWSPVMVPSRGFIHVDIDPEVPGVAYPSVETFAIHSEIKAFTQALLKYFPSPALNLTILPYPHVEIAAIPPQPQGLVQPEILMEKVQKIIVEGSDAVVMAESGNSFAWAINRLQFTQPGRFRVCTGVGSMGHFVTGVVGAALGLGRNSKVVAIVGDGAMLMNSEISTAVKYQLPAVWIVLNDGRYNMCEQGNRAQNLLGADTKLPATDFTMIARGLGAKAINVTQESELEAALLQAMAATVPFVIDVLIDPNRPAPIGGRIKGLMTQGKK